MVMFVLHVEVGGVPKYTTPKSKIRPLQRRRTDFHSNPKINPHSESERIAVCVTGQPRSLGLDYHGGHIMYQQYSKPYSKMYGTVADSIAEMIHGVTAGGGVDIYMMNLF